MKYVCSVCGYIYDEVMGDPDNGIEAGTKWEDLESDAMYALGGIDGKLGDFKGTMNDMQSTQEATFGQRFKGDGDKDH